MTATRSADRMSPRAWGVLLVLCGAIFLEGVDVALGALITLPGLRGRTAKPAEAQLVAAE